MNINDVSTQLLFTTVPIWTENASGQATSATAFIYNCPLENKPGQFIPLLLTNEHVVRSARRGLIELSSRNGESPASGDHIRAEIGGDVLTKYVDEQLDLAAVPIGPLLNTLEENKRPAFFRSIGPELVPSIEAVNDLSALEEIVFIGYPSGIRDGHSGLPIIRRGITATPVWNDFESAPVFLIDAEVFPGSSGSPVFVLNQGAYAAKNGIIVGNRLLVLGVVSQTMRRPEGENSAYLGLGRVVKSSALMAFVAATVAKVQQSSLTHR